MRARRIEFHPDFSDDLAEAAEYDRKLDEVIENPILYAIRPEDGLRRANLETFSYSIRYDWSDETLWVVTFAHHHQDTARWIHRLAALKRR